MGWAQWHKEHEFVGKITLAKHKLRLREVSTPLIVRMQKPPKALGEPAPTMVPW
jgi:hypothetical protein